MYKAYHFPSKIDEIEHNISNNTKEGQIHQTIIGSEKQICCIGTRINAQKVDGSKNQN